jgi:hypothetical protein
MPDVCLWGLGHEQQQLVTAGCNGGSSSGGSGRGSGSGSYQQQQPGMG